MTDSTYTAMLLVVDRSGSMTAIRDDMEGGIATLLETQAGEPGLLTVDVVTFDNQIEAPFVMADPRDIRVIIEPRGSTALYDAMGMGISTFARNLDNLPTHAQPQHVQVIVVTDGHENASREYSADVVKGLVTEKTTAGWDFVFLGADQDAVLEGQRLGFASESSLSFRRNAGSVRKTSESLNRYVGDLRQGEKKGFDDIERREALEDED